MTARMQGIRREISAKILVMSSGFRSCKGDKNKLARGLVEKAAARPRLKGLKVSLTRSPRLLHVDYVRCFWSMSHRTYRSWILREVGVGQRDVLGWRCCLKIGFRVSLIAHWLSRYGNSHLTNTLLIRNPRLLASYSITSTSINSIVYNYLYSNFEFLLHPPYIKRRVDPRTRLGHPSLPHPKPHANHLAQQSSPQTTDPAGAPLL
jgi:hypothetical protein